jgi:hypothetical protein
LCAEAFHFSSLVEGGGGLRFSFASILQRKSFNAVAKVTRGPLVN